MTHHRYLRVGGTGKSGKKKTTMNEKLSEIERCFSVIGFKRAEVESIYKILSAILHLGDIKIEADSTQEHMSEVASISKNDEVLKFGEPACKLLTEIAMSSNSHRSCTGHSHSTLRPALCSCHADDSQSKGSAEGLDDHHCDDTGRDYPKANDN